jgi:hypothetical protein
MAFRHRVLLAALLAAACGSDPAGPPAVQNDLVFERADGTRLTFPAAVFVWCGPWEDGEVPVLAVHVFVGGTGSGWQVRGVRSDITVGQANAFPNNYIWNDPQNVDLFILDPPNELSTQADDSSGGLTFTELNCEAGKTVAFTIDAVVGSELADLPAVRVTGSFRGPVGAAPFGD